MGNRSTAAKTTPPIQEPRILLCSIGRSGRGAFLRILKHRYVYLTLHPLEGFDGKYDIYFYPATGGLQYRRGLAPLFFTSLRKMLKAAICKAQDDGIKLPKNIPAFSNGSLTLSASELELMQMLRENAQISAWARDLRDWD